MKTSQKFHVLRRDTFGVVTAAQTEAGLAGRRVTGADDLLVALAVTGGPASRVLAARGADPATLRRATAERDAADLGSIGVDASTLHSPGRRTPTQAWRRQTALELDDAATELVKRLPSERDLLVALVEHPSGGPRETLLRAGLDPDALLAADWPAERDDAPGAPIPGLLDGQDVTVSATTRFVPVPLDRLAEVLTNPELAAQWLIHQEGVRADGDNVLMETPPADPVLRFEMRPTVRRRDPECVDVVWQRFVLDDPELTEPGYYLHLVATPAPGGRDLLLERGTGGHGRRARFSGWITRTFGRTTARHQVQSIIEVAQSH